MPSDLLITPPPRPTREVPLERRRCAPLLREMRERWAEAPYPVVVEGLRHEDAVCSAASLWSRGRMVAAALGEQDPRSSLVVLPREPGIEWVGAFVGALRDNRMMDATGGMAVPVCARTDVRILCSGGQVVADGDLVTLANPLSMSGYPWLPTYPWPSRSAVLDLIQALMAGREIRLPIPI